jgi:hypothetical protein
MAIRLTRGFEERCVFRQAVVGPVGRVEQRLLGVAFLRFYPVVVH